MLTNGISTAQSWKNLLAYYIDCLEQENRLRCVIKPQDIQKTCYLLPGLSSNFLRRGASSVSVTSTNPKMVEKLQRFVLGDPNSGKRPPSVNFGYPFFVDRDGQLMPLLYVQVGSQRIDNGVGLVQESLDLEINFAAIWEALPGDREVGIDELFAKFDALELKSNDDYFDQALALLLSELEEASGLPVKHIGQNDLDPDALPTHSVIECPLLFHLRAGFTNHLLRELNQLRTWHEWEEVKPALRQLLTETERTPYPEVPELAADPRLYVVPANDSQRKAVASTSQREISVITGPPGTGKSQLILNLVGDAVLRGGTVLIASRNNRAVDVIFERFLNQIDYPGIVRSGKRQYRQEMPVAMRQALDSIRRRHQPQQMEKSRSDYERVLGQIEAQRELISHIEFLTHDQHMYQAEMRDLIDLLPEPVGKSMGKLQVRLEEDEAAQLSAALQSLAADSNALVDKRQALAEEIRAVTSENRQELAFFEQLAAFEQRTGTLLRNTLPGAALENVRDIQTYLDGWQDMLEVLRLQVEVQRHQELATQAQQRAEESKQGLLPEFARNLSDSVQAGYDPQQEETLHASLTAILDEAQHTVELHDQLAELMDSIQQDSEVVHHLLALTADGQGEHSQPSELDVRQLARILAVKDDLFKAHRAGTLRANRAQQLRTLEQEQANKQAEFETILSELDAQFAEARAEVPALMVTYIRPAAEQGTHQEWDSLAAQLSELEGWCDRIKSKQFTLAERVQQGLSRDWALKRLRQGMRATESSLGTWIDAGLLSHPPEGASFKIWANYVHDVSCFAKACALAARRHYVDQQRQAFQAQTEQDITNQSSELETANQQFEENLAQLPSDLVDALRSDSWPFGPIESSVLRDLETAHARIVALSSDYAGVVTRLEELQDKYAVPDEVASMLRALAVRSEQTNLPIAPLALTGLVVSWLQLLQAREAEFEWQQSRQMLMDVDARLTDVQSRVPRALRPDMDALSLQYSDQLAQPVQACLSALRARVDEQFAGWEELNERLAQLLGGNSLQIQGISKAVERAQKDRDYLAGLVVKKAYDHPEQVLEDIKTWELIIQVWRTRTQLSVVSDNLREYPSLEEAGAELDRLLTQRQALAGQVLKERWQQTAAELDVDIARSISHYVDAVEALAEDAGLHYRSFKQQAENNFVAALNLFPVWATTNLSTQDLPLRAGLFDCVIIDEASQCDIPSALPLLFRAKRIVIIGDEKQLRHVATLPNRIDNQLRERYAIDYTYDYARKSLFDLAAHSTLGIPGEILLDEHYRCHPEIIEFSNRNFYDAALRLRTDLSRVPELFRERGCGVYWLNVRGEAERPGPGHVFNRLEEQSVTQLVRRLLEQLDVFEMSEASIGIVTPFRAQADHIQRALQHSPIPPSRVLVGTVHTYQGDERDIMIFSTVATKHLPENSFKFMAREPNLLNVAATRARLALIVVGDHGFFEAQPPASCYYQMAEYARELGKVYGKTEELPIFQPVSDEDRPFELGMGKALREDSPYSNRMTLRQLLASCQEYLWWYDPYLTMHALDALALALQSSNGHLREVRLLTQPDFWENARKERECITKKRITPLKQELAAKGIQLRLAVTSYDPASPPPHDRYLFAANRAVNMPPLRSIFQDMARLAEFLPSTVESEAFEAWWQQAKVVFE